MKHHRSHIDRVTQKIVVGLAILALLMFSLPPAAQAQEQPDEPDSAIPRVYLPFIGTAGLQSAPPAEASITAEELDRRNRTPLRLLVDTDPGVDDAVALTWLLSQNKVPVNLLGVVTVAGNTSVLAATNNALNVLARLQATTVPVVIGAPTPMVQPLSKTSWFIHGPDGLWFLGIQNPQNPAGMAPDTRSANDFYCHAVDSANVKLVTGATLLALGPLTNIANAIIACPETMKTLGSLVILGGAKFGGNKTPVAEFNFWQDPEAAAIVLAAFASELDRPSILRLVPLDTFTVPTVQLKDIEKLIDSRNAAASFLAPALQQYISVQLENTGKATIPDAVAAAYALDPRNGITQEALVEMVLEPGQARGQSVIGLSFSERIAMIADDAELSGLAISAFPPPYYFPDPGFNLGAALSAIYMREPGNAFIVTGTSDKLLTKLVLSDLRK